jgi:hypothetical protein
MFGSSLPVAEWMAEQSDDPFQRKEPGRQASTSVGTQHQPVMKNACLRKQVDDGQTKAFTSSCFSNSSGISSANYGVVVAVVVVATVVVVVLASASAST